MVISKLDLNRNSNKYPLSRVNGRTISEITHDSTTFHFATKKSTINKTIQAVQEPIPTLEISGNVSQGSNPTPSNPQVVKVVDRLNIGGVNNLVVNGNFESASGWGALKSTIAVSNNVGLLTITQVASSMGLEQNISFTSGHKYFLSINITPPKSTTYYFREDTTAFADGNYTANQEHIIETIFTSIGGSVIRFYVDSGSNCEVGDIFKFKNITLIDLTLMYGTGNEPTSVDVVKKDIALSLTNGYLSQQSNSNSLTIDELLTNDKILVRKDRSNNLWDEIVESGYINEDGTLVSGNAIRSKNYIKINPSTKYYILTSATSGLRVVYYDENKSFYDCTIAKNEVITTPSICEYIKISTIVDDSITTYNNDISILPIAESGGIWDETYESGYLVNGVETASDEYWRSGYIEVRADSTLYLKSNVSCTLCYYGINKEYLGRITKNNQTFEIAENVFYMRFFVNQSEYSGSGISINKAYYQAYNTAQDKVWEYKKWGKVDLGSLSFGRYQNNNGDYVFQASLDCAIYTSNIYCAKFTPTNDSWHSINDNEMTTRFGDGDCIAIRCDTYTDASSFISAMSGVYLYYELSTPTITDITSSSYTLLNTNLFKDFNSIVACSNNDNSVVGGLNANYWQQVGTLPSAYREVSGIEFVDAPYTIFDEVFEDGYILNGEEVEQQSSIRSKNYTFIYGGEEYNFSTTETDRKNWKIVYYKAIRQSGQITGYQYLSDITLNTSGTFTPPENCDAIRLTSLSLSSYDNSIRIYPTNEENQIYYYDLTTDLKIELSTQDYFSPVFDLDFTLTEDFDTDSDICMFELDDNLFGGLTYDSETNQLVVNTDESWSLVDGTLACNIGEQKHIKIKFNPSIRYANLYLKGYDIEGWNVVSSGIIWNRCIITSDTNSTNISKGQVIKGLISCVNESTNVGGFYELVSGEFLTKQVTIQGTTYKPKWR